MPKIMEIEDTPNPNAVKFTLKERICWGKAKNFSNRDAFGEDELAAKLFAIEHVANVFYMDNWITVTQDGQAAWSELVRRVAQPIREAKAVEVPKRETIRPTTPEQEDPRLVAFRKIIEDRIRPTLIGDGGDLEVMAVSGNLLCIRYYGTCGSCPSSQTSTLIAIENLARTLEPDIEVVTV